MKKSYEPAETGINLIHLALDVETATEFEKLKDSRSTLVERVSS
ncbi:hypothetical protein ACKAW9_03810 [Xanthomonas vasicola pv. vasculorum]